MKFKKTSLSSKTMQKNVRKRIQKIPFAIHFADFRESDEGDSDGIL